MPISFFAAHTVNDTRDGSLRTGLVRLASALLLVGLSAAASAQLSITPITWDVVGLDSNRPLTSGPELFPVGAEICNVGAANSGPITASHVWGNGDTTYIYTRPGSLDILNFAPLAPGECVDAYYEIQVERTAAAFEQARPYTIVATDGTFTAETPDTRQIFIERLVSQNRNTTTQIRWGQLADESDWQTLGAGGSLNLAIGERYFVELTTETATGYEQLESFLTLSNTIFQVISVETLYGNLTAPLSRVQVPHPQLYADGCLWEPDFDSPNYLSCLADGKAGGEIVSLYEIDIISGGGDEIGLEALIYDKSGSSFHYNLDFSQSPGDIITYDPTASGFAKRFFPDTIAAGGTSRLVFTITNPNPVAIGGYNFIDNLPAGVEVAPTPNASTTCGGVWNPLAGDTSLAFDIDTDVIGPNSTCSIIVDVTAANVGTYDNVSENLFIGDFDTGLQATDQLIVNNDPPPAACVLGTTHSTWTMAPAAGTTVPPLPTTVYSLNIADAIATFNPIAGAVQSITTTNGQPANAWSGRGWPIATSPVSAGPGPNDPTSSSFQFELNTSDFATNPAELMSISLDMRPVANGDWANNTNITMNVHVSTNGGATWTTIINDNTVVKTAWNTRTASFAAGFGTTLVRVNVSGIQIASGATARVLLDNIIFTGCGPGAPGTIPDPPTLTKNFSPDPIGAGEVSTLTFTIGNPNTVTPDDDLSGIDFVDNLPVGVFVAPVPNVSTSCGGTVAAVAGGSLISLTNGVLPANAGGTASCTVNVDVTSSAVATHVNISDFIYADESGQNNTPTGFATDTLTVLAPPIIEKAFDPTLVLLGVTPGDLSALVFTVTNPNTFTPISGVAFVDNLPAGLSVAAAPNVLSNGCGAPTITATAGSGTIDFSGGTIAAGDVCVVSVDVEGPVGVYDNISSDVSHVVSGVTYTGNNATAQLVVDNPIPSISLLKQVGLTSDPNGIWQDYLPIEVPTDVYYKLTIENIGEVELTNITLNDPTIDTSSCTWPASLPVADGAAPLAHIAECVVGPITINASGEVINTATAFGDHTLPAAGTVSDTDSATVASVELTLDKEADRATFTAAGETINYTFTVTNTGASLEGPVTITDPLIAGVTCPAVNTVGDLDNFFETGETIVCTGSYTTTAADVTNGSVDNTAFATVQGFDSPPDSVTVPLAAASIALTKTITAGNPYAAVGDFIQYTITATNTGDLSLSDVEISDPGATIGACTPAQPATLAPGATLSCPAFHTATQADIDAGSYTNTATVVAQDPGGNPLTDSAQATANATQTPALTLVKSGTLNDGGDGQADAGDTISYTFAVTNTGNVTLTNIVLTDPQVTVVGGPIASLAVGATDSTTFTASYTLTQADIDAGTFTNTATATSDEGATDDDSDTQNLGANPALTITKTQTGGPNPVTAAGQVIDYTIVVENTGNVTQTGVATTDVLPDGSAGTLVGPIESVTADSQLEVGESWTYTISYTVTQADIDAASPLVNTASVSTTQVPGPTEDDATTPIVAPQIVASKTSNPASGTNVVAGQTIVYTLSLDVTNGPTTDPVVLTDTLDAQLENFQVVSNVGGFTVGGANPYTFTLPAGTASGTYVVEYSADVVAGATGSVGNNVIATGGGDPDPECPSCTTNHPLGDPVVSVSKSSDPVSGTEVIAGQTITYTLTATITDAALTAALDLTDTLGAGLTFGSVTNAGSFTANTAGNPLVFTLASGTAPGTYSITYTATVDNDATGSVGNNVIATGGGDPDPECPSCTTNHPLGDPVVSVSKSSDPVSGTEVIAGQTITYTLTATITDAALTAALDLTDTLGAGLTFGSVTNAGSFTANTAGNPLVFTLASGTAPGTYSITYTATVDNDATGSVGNNVIATGGGDPDPECPSCTTNHPLGDPVVSVTKSSDPVSGTEVIAGQTITYTLTATITDAALTAALDLTDTLGAGLTFGSVTNAGSFTANTAGNPLVFTLPSGTLPGTYAVEYTATVDNDATGSVGNNVIATGGGDPDPECPSCTTNHPLGDPVVSVTKSSDPVSGTEVIAGQTITYTLTATITEAALTAALDLTDTLGAGLTFGSVTNAGSFTANTAGNPLVFTLPSGTLPGTYAVEYTATVDNDATGSVGNNVIATGGGDPDPECPSCTTNHPLGDPVVVVSKSSNPVSGTEVIAGQTITYTLTATITEAALTAALDLTDTLGAGLTFGSVTNAGSFTANTAGNPLVFTLASGTAPGTYSITYTATVDNDATGSVGNNVIATGGGDPDPECPSCTTNHPLGDPVVSVSKSSDPVSGTEVIAGQTITYTLTATITDAALTAALDLTDTLGAGLTFGSVTNAGSFTANTAGNPLVFTLPSGTLPGTYAVEYTATVDNDATGSVGNNVIATGGGDPDPECPSCTTNHPLGDPVVSVSKSSDPVSGTEVIAGQTITYTLTATITDAALTAALDLTDTLGAGLTFGSVTNAGSFTANTAGNPLVFTLPSGTLPGTYAVEYTATVDNDATGSVGNNVIATGGGDPDPECPSCTTNHPLGDPVVSVSKSSDPVSGTEVIAGQTITYTLTATITDAALTAALDLTDTLGAGLTFGSVTNAGSFTANTAGNPLVFTLPSGTLPGTYAVEYTATVDNDATGSVGNNVIATGGGDPDPECPSCTTNHPLGDPVVVVSKASNPASGTEVIAGQTITYTLTATITDAALTAALDLTDTLGAGLTFGSVTNAGSFTANTAGNPLVFTLPSGTLPGTYAVEYTVTVDNDATGSVGNVVVPTGGGDPDPECPSCSTNHPLGDPEVVVSKSSNPASGTEVIAGQTITYTLTATITDAALTAALDLTDTLGAGLTFGSVTNAGSFTANTAGNPLVFTLPSGTLPGTYAVEYTVTVDNDATGSVGNVVVPTGGGDPDPECPSCTTNHPLGDPVVVVSKASNPASGTEVIAGQTITYTLTATITDAALTAALDLTDTLGAGLTFGSVTNAGSFTANTAGNPLVFTLPSGTLPGTYAVEYTATVDNDATGSVGNVVVPTGGGDPDPECPSCTTNHPLGDPVVVVSKASNPASGTEVIAGQTITYTLTATITDAALTAALDLTDTLGAGLTFGSVTNAGSFTANTAGNPLVFTLPSGTLPGIYAVEYTVTVDNDATGSVGNVVVPTGGGDPDPECPSCTTNHPLGDPVVVVSKASNPASGTEVIAGQTITYTLTATITDAALTAALDLTDTLGAGLTFGSVTNAGSFTANTAGNPLVFTLPSGTLPGTYSVVYTATVDNDATGSVGNVVVPIGGGDPDPECPSCTTNHPLGDPVVVVSKASNPASGTEVIAGQTITYTLTATVSDAALTADLNLSDTLGAGLTFGSVTNAGSFTANTAGNPLVFTLPSGTLPGTYAVEYTVTVDNDATGSVGNVVVPTGGGDPDPECPSCSTNHPLGDPEVVVSKSSNPASGTEVIAGQTITYTLTATVSDAALTADLNLSDTLGAGLTFGSVTNAGSFTANTAGNPLVFTLPSGTLPGTYAVEYTVTVDNDATGSVGNVVVPTGGGDPDPECPSCTTNHPLGDPVVVVSKASNPVSGTQVPVGQTITYTLTATITNAALTADLVLTDTLDTDLTFDAVTNAGSFTANTAGNPLVFTLPSGTVPGTYAVEYTVTVNNDATGTVNNNVVPTGGGDPDPECPSCTTNHPVGVPDLLLVKQAVLDDTNSNTFADAGEIIEYTLTATNTGNVTLTDVEIVDPLIGTLSCTPTQPATLAPSEELICTGSYTVLDLDVENGGSIVNIATVTAPDPFDPINNPPLSDDDTTSTPVVPVPGLELVKLAVLDDTVIVNGFADPGETINYTLTATNTGNLGLTDVVIDDPLIGALVCTPAQPAALAPDEELVCTGSYLVSQLDLDNGPDIVNIATVAAPDPVDPINNPPLGDDDTETVPTVFTAQIELDKIITAGNPYANVGDVISYQLTATNTGTVTLTNVVISDPQAVLGVCLPAQPTTLLPGENLVCAATYMVGQGDINLGSFTNTATVNATDPNDDPVIDTDQAVATGPVASPLLDVDKVLSSNADEDGSGNVTLGDTLSYTLTATNIGNVTLTNVTLSDSLIPSLNCVPVQPASLDPTESLVCTGEYVVQPVDVTNGQVENTATGDSDQTPPDSSTVITPVFDPQVVVSKVSDPISGTEVTAGQTITYTVTATITDAPLIADLELSDTLDANLTFLAVTNAGSFAINTAGNPLLFTLPSGTAAGVYSITYTATVNADANGTVGNSVVITGPGGDPDPECPSCTTNHPVADPEVVVIKASDPASGTEVIAGQTITYTLTATITDAALTADLDLSDTLDADLTFVGVTNPGVFTANTAGNPLVFTLASGTLPGTYSVEYTATVNNDATGTVGNSVVITGPGGDPDPECPSCTTNHPLGDPEVVVSKVSDPVSGTDVLAGQTITYTITATVSGAALTADLDLNDTFDAGLTFGAVTTNPGGFTVVLGSPVVFTLASGTVPGIYSISYTVTVNADASGTVGNVVVPTGGGDPDPECPSCSTNHPVFNLTLDKSVTDLSSTGPNTWLVSYELLLENIGDADGTYSLTDTLNFTPNGLVLGSSASVSTIGGTLNASLAGGTFVPQNGVLVPISAPNLTISAGDQHRYILNIPFGVVEGQLQNEVCTGTPGNGLFNEAEVTGPVPAIDNDCASVEEGSDVAIDLLKTVELGVDNNGNNYGDVGDVLVYSFEITNIGADPLTDIQLIDLLVDDLVCAPQTSGGNSIEVLPWDGLRIESFELGGMGMLDPGDILVCTASHTLTQIDVDRRRVENTATVLGTGPLGEVVTSVSTAIYTSFQ